MAGEQCRFGVPPQAVRGLAGLGVDCVALAANHVLDFGMRRSEPWPRLGRRGAAWRHMRISRSASG